MQPLKSATREVKGEIMKTDVFVRVFSSSHEADEMESDLDTCFRMFRDFSERFSRFREESELCRLNASEDMQVSPECFELLETCRFYHEKTGGIFDPAVLPILEREGYSESFDPRHTHVSSAGRAAAFSAPRHTFRDVVLAPDFHVRKPLALRIDFGGIGKGYIVDQITDFLKRKYRHFIVDAGGDMYVSGEDLGHGYRWWAIDIEDAHNKARSVDTLLLSDRSVATSGTNRRIWHIAGEEKSHLIDPITMKSTRSGVLSVTVVGAHATEADVYAKTLLLLDRERGLKFAQANGLAAYFIGKDGTITVSDAFARYLWKGK